MTYPKDLLTDTAKYLDGAIHLNTLQSKYSNEQVAEALWILSKDHIEEPMEDFEVANLTKQVEFIKTL